LGYYTPDHWSGVADERDKEKRDFIKAQRKVKELSEKLNDLLLGLDKLREENNQLIKNIQKNLGVRLIAYLLSLPFDKIFHVYSFIRGGNVSIFINSILFLVGKLQNFIFIVAYLQFMSNREYLYDAGEKNSFEIHKDESGFKTEISIKPE
jgi:hypothetical protein